MGTLATDQILLPILACVALVPSACAREPAVGQSNAAPREPAPSRALPWEEKFMPASSDRPGTEATCALFPPWEQEGVWALRAPETIRSDLGLLYVDWELSARVPILKVIGKPAWIPNTEGEGITFDCTLERGVSFRIQVEPDADELFIKARLTNDSSMDLADLETQFCLVHNGVSGFEDPWAQRTFVLMEGEFVALGSTKPGIAPGIPPAYIVTYTPGEVRAPPSPPNSWRTSGPSQIPLIATVSSDGQRYVAIAFENAFKLMTNCGIPCIHADPRFPDCASGESVELLGRVYFGEGPLAEVLDRFHADFPHWKPDKTE